MRLIFILVSILTLISCQSTSPGDLNESSSKLYAEGNYSAAEVASRKALAAAEVDFGSQSEEVAAVLINLGVILKDKAEYGKAEKVYLEALKILKLRNDTSNKDMAYLYNNIADIYVAMNRGDDARSYYLKALTYFRTLGGIELAVSLNNIAELEIYSDSYSTAESYLEEAADIIATESAPDHAYINNYILLY